MKLRIIAALLIGLLAIVAFNVAPDAAQEKSADESKQDLQTRVKASNVVILRKHVDEEVVVYGRVVRTAKSGSGHHFLNFSGDGLSVVCFKDDVSNFGEDAPADTYKNKDVEISGKLELYKGKLQIKLRDPKQIKIVDLSKSSPSQKTVELKQIGKEAWISPAGLRYQGRDPMGLTRVEHVLRHAKDIPDRDGPHGVFDGGKGVAFAVIDEAWKLAQKKKLRADVEGDRSSYLVRMGRRVGFLGGQTGKRRRNPELTRVFIVFETDTKNIVTAFPR